jgi:predicted dehydrogenase
MKTIGFIDYYLDEWHANMYPNWIRAASKGEWEVTLAWEETAKPGGKPIDAWCAAQNVRQAASLKQVVEECDALIVLSPDNMERHEALADLPLRSGKPVYVDKTFAPTVAAARRMFAKAKRYGTPLCSSSALRFSPDLRTLMKETIGAEPVRLVSARGHNDFRRQYAVHTVEMLVMLLGVGARRVMHAGTPATPVVLIDYEDGRRGVLELNVKAFQLLVEFGSAGKTVMVDIKQDFWNSEGGFVPSLLRFFETGEAPAPETQTLEIMAVIEAGSKAVDRPHKWIRVPRR